MKLWQRRIVGALTLGGGFLGTVVGFTTLIGDANFVSKAIGFSFTVLYTWGIWCGIRFVENSANSTTPIRVYWLLQIPYFTSPIISFHFFGGAWVLTAIQTADPRFLWALQFGDHFSGTLMQPAPFGIGVNLVAIAIFGFLTFSVSATPPDNSFRPAAIS
jgi:hypothetical protein